MEEAATFALEAGSSLAAAGLGMATANWQDRRQLEQQQKLQSMQIQGQQAMGRFNQQMALQMWDKTNYAAQVEQLKKAGLNPGLLYGMGGAGGASTTHTPGQVTGGQAPQGGGEIGMGLQLGIQALAQKAQIKLAEAQANKANAEAHNITNNVPRQINQEILESRARTGNLNTLTENERLKQKSIELDNEYKSILNSIATQTIDEAIRTIQAKARETEGIADQEQAEGRLKQEEYNEYKQQLKLATIQAQLDIAQTKMGTQKLSAETSQIITERIQSWEKLNIQEREIKAKELMTELQKTQTEFQTSTPQQFAQWVDLLKNIVGLGASVTPAAKPNKIGY